MAASSERVLLWVAILILLPTSLANISADEVEPVQNGALSTVQYLDYSCYQQSLQCQANESQHIVEYFGADWCEPCHLVEDNLAALNREDTVILQHHASVEDFTYLNYSKHRFEDKYRLLFVPSIVVDGKGLLTGSSQALDLNSSLDSNSGLENSSLSMVELNSGFVYWNNSTAQKLTIWRLDAVAHQSRNFTHQYLATDSLQIDLNDENISSQEGVNISALLQDWTGRLVFIFENEGSPQLQSYSDKTASNMDIIDDQEGETSELNNPNPAQYAMIWFVIMLLLIAPAIMLWIRELKRPKQVFFEQE